MATISADRDCALDATRGIAILSMLVVGSSVPFAQLRHAAWHGFTYADIVYPMFLVCAGAALELSWSKGYSHGVPTTTLWMRLLLRAVKLFAIGLFLLSASYSTPRFNLGTLQCIAIASLIGGVTLRYNARTRLLLIGALYVGIIAFSIVSTSVAADWIDRWEAGHTRAEAIDRAILGKPRGSEGILATAGAASCLIFGTLIGLAILERRAPAERATRVFSIAAALVVIGFFFSLIPDPNRWFYVPLNAHLMTPSFAMVSSGIAFFCYGFAFLLSERRSAEPILRPFVIVGTNPLAAYVFVQLATTWVLHGWRVIADGRTFELGAYFGYLVAGFFGETAGAMTEPLLKCALAFTLCYSLWRRGIVVRL